MFSNFENVFLFLHSTVTSFLWERIIFSRNSFPGKFLRSLNCFIPLKPPCIDRFVSSARLVIHDSDFQVDWTVFSETTPGNNWNLGKQRWRIEQQRRHAGAELRRVLRMHSSRRTGLPLHKLWSSQRAGVARLSRVLPSPDPGRIRTRPGSSPVQTSQGPVRGSSRSQEQARAEMEPRVASSSRDGLGGGSALLLRALHRENYWTRVSLHGRRVRCCCDGRSHVPRRSSPLARVASV